ncbi:nucleotide exchange factor GrpE [Geitlerinema sp. PCC 9228]|jgi:molecular chaperone GrpE|uniref:nucleotide exchange factor GrpE n=1 Tax=Geitlerinema sp. PCC 9228 TaxID=111611 RepID=UPI0008F99934|nr:nucleotide exchange factor GrpE [Geitlerinema sp. PCC 9228]
MIEEDKQRQTNQPENQTNTPESQQEYGAASPQSSESEPATTNHQDGMVAAEAEAAAASARSDASQEGGASEEAMAAGEGQAEAKDLEQQLANSQQENNALKGEINHLKTQLEETKAQYARLAADFENFRKRTQKEKEDQELQVKCATIKDLLPVVDNFERARAHIKPQTDGEMNIHKSYQGVYKQLVDCLKQLGVTPMRPEGQEFDPNYHEAMMQEPSSEYPEGTVIEEFMRGYMLDDRILRHAMVKVAAAPEPEADTSQPSDSSETSDESE